MTQTLAPEHRSTLHDDVPAPFPRGRAVVAMLLVVVCNAWAFAYTASQLRDGVDIASPVAYVPFVPMVALAAAAQRWRPRPEEPRSRPHRAADWTAFAGLATMAVLVGAGVPHAFTTETLSWRADLAAMPLVAAAIAVAFFGLRMLWRLRTVFWFLTLMSPALYRPVAAPIRTFTSWSTGWAVAGVSHVLPFVTATRQVTDGRQVDVAAAKGVVTLEVAEVCAGNGAVLAGLFVAASMWMLCEGSTRAKLRWTGLCVMACWLGNIARLVALFGATSLMGQEAATGWFHEFAGLVGLIVALVGALGCASRMGLSPRPALRGPLPPHTGLPVLRRSTAVVVLAFVVVMVSVAQSATSGYDLLRGRSDEPTVSAGMVVRDWAASPPSDELTILEQPDVPWASQYFGSGARWETFLSTGPRGGSIVAIDIISSSDSTRFDTYGLAACFGFHGWRMVLNKVVPMTGDRLAEQIVYSVDGDDAQREAKTSGAAKRTIAVMSWRQRTTDGRVERITLQQQQPESGEYRLDDLESLAAALGTEMDLRGSG